MIEENKLEASALAAAIEKQAEQLARAAHEGQKDTVTGAPYITHIERVVGLVNSPEAKAVAWLHDVLEDTTVTAGELYRVGFPERIYLAVVALTRRKDQPYTEYIAWLKDHGNALALEVKRADLRDHLQPNCPERLRPRYERALALLAGVSAEGSRRRRHERRKGFSAREPRYSTRSRSGLASASAE